METYDFQIRVVIDYRTAPEASWTQIQSYLVNTTNDEREALQIAKDLLVQGGII